MRLLSSLTNRIFLASAALTLVCMGIAIYLVNVRVTAAAEDELLRGLEQTGAVVDQQLATVSDLYTVLARQVADLPEAEGRRWRPTMRRRSSRSPRSTSSRWTPTCSW